MSDPLNELVKMATIRFAEWATLENKTSEDLYEMFIEDERKRINNQQSVK